MIEFLVLRLKECIIDISIRDMRCEGVWVDDGISKFPCSFSSIVLAQQRAHSANIESVSSIIASQSKSIAGWSWRMKYNGEDETALTIAKTVWDDGCVTIWVVKDWIDAFKWAWLAEHWLVGWGGTKELHMAWKAPTADDRTKWDVEYKPHLMIGKIEDASTESRTRTGIHEDKNKQRLSTMIGSVSGDKSFHVDISLSESWVEDSISSEEGLEGLETRNESRPSSFIEIDEILSSSWLIVR